MTTDEVAAEITRLKERCDKLELDIAFMKAQRVQDCLPQPIQPWVSPSSPYPYWQNPNVIYSYS